jgi:2-phosphoglycerate kinase
VKKETYLSSECHREAHAEEHFAAPEMMIEAGTDQKNIVQTCVILGDKEKTKEHFEKCETIGGDTV